MAWTVDKSPQKGSDYYNGLKELYGKFISGTFTSALTFCANYYKNHLPVDHRYKNHVN